MKTKLLCVLCAIVTNFGLICAEKVQIGDLYYILDALSLTAEVVQPNNSYSVSTITTAKIPTSLEYKSATYTVISIGDHAFQQCTNLTSVTIPLSVTKIGDYAFSTCRSLTRIALPDSIKSIGEGAFSECSGISYISIPNSVIHIGNRAFESCSKLENIVVASENINFCSIDGVLFNKNQTTLIQYPSGKQGGYIIPNSVTRLENYAFSACSNLTGVTIPNSVITMGDCVFEGCKGLTSITLPNSIKNIGLHVFSNCTGLKDEIYNNHIFAFMPISFSGAYVIPDGIEIIAGGAFSYCSGLTDVTIPNSITSIEDMAFLFCYGLTNIIIPNSVVSIGNSAFQACFNLTTITIPSSVTSIGNSAFSGCSSLMSVTIPSSVTSIGGGAFCDCRGLTSVILPYGVTNIGNSTFSGCSGLTSVTIPNSITSIGDYAFHGCSGLISVAIPNSVTSIGDSSFEGCKALNSITCEAIIPPTCGVRVFVGIESSIILYVHAGSLSAYKVAETWMYFDNIMPIPASIVDITEVIAEPTEDCVIVQWPMVTGAYSYELVIKDKSGNIVCTLIFNTQGQLTQIAFNAPGRDNAPQQTQTAGFAFTVTGLESGTKYDMTITAKNSNGSTLDTKTVSFTTKGDMSAINSVSVETKIDGNKIVREGQLFIQRGDEVFNAQGARVR